MMASQQIVYYSKLPIPLLASERLAPHFYEEQGAQFFLRIADDNRYDKQRLMFVPKIPSMNVRWQLPPWVKLPAVQPLCHNAFVPNHHNYVHRC